MLRTTADLRRTEGLASGMGGWSSIRRTATDGRGRGAVVFLHAGGSVAALSQGTGMNQLEVGVFCNATEEEKLMCDGGVEMSKVG